MHQDNKEGSFFSMKFAEPIVWLQSGVPDQTKPENLRRQSLTTKIAAALNQGLSSLGEKLGESLKAQNLLLVLGIYNILDNTSAALHHNISI